MTIVDFLRKILPDKGLYCLAVFEGADYPTHHFYQTLESMGQAALEFDSSPENVVYHACATYQNEQVTLPSGEIKVRVIQNTAFVKSFWADIDCKLGDKNPKKYKGYLSFDEGKQAVKQFCIDSGFPIPNIVTSGNGMHLYWTLTKPIPADKWRAVAAALKAIFNHYGFKADPSRTADVTSILRPVGTHNKKNAPIPVRMVLERPDIEPGEFLELIKAQVKQHGIQLQTSKSPNYADNSDLLGYVPDLKSSAEAVAEKCAQVREVRDSKGNVDYQQWWNTMGIIKHSVEGDELAHEWSKGHPTYSERETQAKIDSWSLGPTLCQTFEADNPDGCEGCPHRGKIKTPLVLGRVVPEPTQEVIEVEADDGEVEITLPELPKGYGCKNDVMVRYMVDKEGITREFPFATTRFNVVHRIRREGGDYGIGIRMYLPPTTRNPKYRVRDFEIENMLIESPQKLAEAVSRFELNTTHGKDSKMHLTAYIKDSLDKLKREVDEINTLTTFGWKDEFQSFLVGDRLYHSDGTVRRVLLGGNAKAKQGWFPAPTGTLDGYRTAVEQMYLGRGREAFQYIIASSFGSILTPFADTNYKGILFSVVSSDTGRGKTTAIMAGMYAFGDADAMMQKNKEMATFQARAARMGLLQNLPGCIDEIGTITAEDLAQFVLIVTGGQDRDRMMATKNLGVRMAEAQTWSMTMFATANTDLHGLLATLKSNTEAEAVRVVQINVEKYPGMKLDDVTLSQHLKARIQENQGVAGDAFLRYVVSNLDVVRQKMATWSQKLAQDMPNEKLRFYRYQAVCTFTALEICTELNIFNFDINKLYEFALDLFSDLAGIVKEQNTLTPAEAFERMVAQLSPRLIHSFEYRDSRDSKGPEEVPRIYGTPAGRYIHASGTTDDVMAGKLFLIRKEITDWCQEQRFDFKKLLDWCKFHGILLPWSDRITLGRGTNIQTGNQRVICFDMKVAEEMIDQKPNLKLISSSKTDTINAASQ